MPSIDLLRGVYLEERVYSDADTVHKMGQIKPGDIVHLIEEYNGWYRVDPEGSNAPSLLPPHNNDGSDGPPWDYNEWWVKDRPDGLFGPVEVPVPEPEPEPEPGDEPSDEEIARVIRFLFGK